MEQYLPNPIIKDDLQGILSDAINWNYLSGKAILVTGANGFVPSYIVYTLAELNDTIFVDKQIMIYALVRNKEKAERKFSFLLTKPYFHLIINDVAIPLTVNEKIDIILHAASQASPKYYGTDPVGVIKANSIGTSNMLDYAIRNGAEKFLFVSSGDIYGNMDNSTMEVTEESIGRVDPLNIRSCYSESKRIGETMCVCWSLQYNLHVNILRLYHTYGPGIELDDGRVFADFAKNVINNENIVLNSDGKAKRPFLYITDTILALFRILFYGENRNAYNVAADSDTEIYELASLLCGLFPEKKLSVKFSESFLKGYIPSTAVGGVKISTKKIKELGWKQQISIKNGFRRMIESYLY
jgi:nucleoside-diphosphate-sugar epimerase